jgi:mono/diheme cytochrome c family protein
VFSFALAIALKLTVAATPAAPAPNGGPDGIDVSSYPAEQQERYALFRQKCSKCHGLSLALTSGLSSEDWRRHMKKMALRPQAGISDAQAKSIIAFLKFHEARNSER